MVLGLVSGRALVPALAASGALVPLAALPLAVGLTPCLLPLAGLAVLPWARPGFLRALILAAGCRSIPAFFLLRLAVTGAGLF